MERLFHYLTCVASVMVLSATAASAATEKLAHELKGTAPNENLDVIVQYKAIPTDIQHAKVSRLGVKLKHRYDALRAGHYSMSAKAIQALSEDPDVTYISPDRAVKGLLNFTIGAVHADIAHQFGLTGRGQGVALIDSGVDTSRADVHSGVAYSQDFTGSGSTNDGFGHGTHVAGILLSTGTSSQGVYTGMAPGANLVNLRVLDDSGTGTDSQVIAAINRAIQLQNTYGIAVINLSLGRPVYEKAALDPLCQAVEAAWKAGIVVVVAAGNDGRNNTAGTNATAPLRLQVMIRMSSLWVR